MPEVLTGSVIKSEVDESGRMFATLQANAKSVQIWYQDELFPEISLARTGGGVSVQNKIRRYRYNEISLF